MSSRTIYLNGQFIGAQQARLSPLDRGFLYGDSAFSTLRACQGRLAHYGEHWEQLAGNLSELAIALPASRASLREILLELLVRNALSEGEALVRVQVSRGASETLGLPLPAEARPTLLALAYRVGPELARRRERGISLVTVAGLHAGGTSRIKLSNYAKNLLCTKAARERGADEGVFVDGSGCVAEASAANLFFVSQGVLRTPAPESGLLPGITRAHVLALARRHRIPTEEGCYRPKQVARAQEVFLTASVSGIVPVHHFDGRAIGGFEQRPLTREIASRYEAFSQEQMEP